MTTENPASKFLNLERQAELVLEELEKLRGETSNYSTAATGLETAINHISTVSDHLNELSGKIVDVIETLGNIGTAELLANSKAVQDEVKRLKTETQSLHEELGSILKVNVDVLRNEIKGMAGEIQSLREQSSAHLTKIQFLHEESNSVLKSNVDALRNEIKCLVGEVQSSREQSSAQFKDIADYQRKSIFSRLFGGKSRK